MTRRHALRLLLVAITLAAAGASVASGNFWIAGGMVVCALATATLPLAKRASPEEVKMLLDSLRVSQQAGAPAVNAVVMSPIIFIGKSAIFGGTIGGYALLFRDEIGALVWRELATLLRHQPHPAPELKKIGQRTE